MAKIVRYNGNLVPFASSSLGTERTIFGEVTQADDITSQFTPDFLRGWGIVGPSDQPTLQDFNAVSYTHGQILAYLHQVGVAEFNVTQEYHLHSYTNSAGILYKSLVNGNTGNTPASSPASWQNIAPLGSTTVAGLLEVATNAEMAAGLSTALVPSVAAVMSIFSKRVFGTSDYIRIPDVPGGLIIQFGSVTTALGGAFVNFPVPFPTAAVHLSGTGNAVTPTPAIITSNINSLTQGTVYSSNGSGGGIGIGVFWLAIGY